MFDGVLASATASVEILKSQSDWTGFSFFSVSPAVRCKLIGSRGAALLRIGQGGDEAIRAGRNDIARYNGVAV